MLLYSNTTACCNSSGKVQYIKMLVHGPHQLVQLNSTISTQSSPQGNKAVISTHRASAVISSPDAHKRIYRSGSMCDSNNQQHISQIVSAKVLSETVQPTSKFGAEEASLTMEAVHFSVIPSHP